MKMSKEHTEIWDAMFSSSSMKATNFAWSKKYRTCGCIAGPNVYYHAPSIGILKKSRCLYWLPTNFQHMFETNTIAVDSYQGGFVRPKDIIVLRPGNFPLILNWDCLTPYKCENLMKDVSVLQDIIVKQDQAFDELNARKKKYKEKYKNLKNVCNKLCKYVTLTFNFVR